MEHLATWGPENTSSNYMPGTVLRSFHVPFYLSLKQQSYEADTDYPWSDEVKQLAQGHWAT